MLHFFWIILNHFFKLWRSDFENFLWILNHFINFLDSIVLLHSACIYDVISIQYHIATHTSSVAVHFIKSVLHTSSWYEVHILCFFSLDFYSTQWTNNNSLWITITQSDILREDWIKFFDDFTAWKFFHKKIKREINTHVSSTLYNSEISYVNIILYFFYSKRNHFEKSWLFFVSLIF